METVQQDIFLKTDFQMKVTDALFIVLHNKKILNCMLCIIQSLLKLMKMQASLILWNGIWIQCRSSMDIILRSIHSSKFMSSLLRYRRLAKQSFMDLYSGYGNIGNCGIILGEMPNKAAGDIMYESSTEVCHIKKWDIESRNRLVSCLLL